MNKILTTDLYLLDIRRAHPKDSVIDPEASWMKLAQIALALALAVSSNAEASDDELRELRDQVMKTKSEIVSLKAEFKDHARKVSYQTAVSKQAKQSAHHMLKAAVDQFSEDRRRLAEEEGATKHTKKRGGGASAHQGRGCGTRGDGRLPSWCIHDLVIAPPLAGAFIFPAVGAQGECTRTRPSSRTPSCPRPS